jgi:hypothetical protein
VRSENLPAEDAVVAEAAPFSPSPRASTQIPAAAADIRRLRFIRYLLSYSWYSSFLI